MISIYNVINKKVKDNEEYIIGEFRGLSTDEKPTNVGNGSVFIEIDTQKIFFYDIDSETWKEV